MKFPEKSLPTLFIEEPQLEFAYGQTCPNPKDGLYLYGPHQRPKRAKEIRVGVVGTNAGITYFKAWAEKLKRRVNVPPPGKTDKPKTQPSPPWKLAGIRPGVCYVGLVYKVIPNDKRDFVCCAAQMFLSEGDGVVFRGANGPWKTSDYEFHLGAEAAKSLMEMVITAYREKHHENPREIFIHGRTFFNNKEWEAFASAVPVGTNVVGVRIQSTDGDVKLYRDGDYPVLRGSAVVLDDRNAYLWTNGYAPQLDTYIGPETPNPLFVSVLRSKEALPKIEGVLRDIMGLTKINYNACNFNDSLPVTVRFADKVGDVLVMGSAKDAERQPFKFYV